MDSPEDFAEFASWFTIDADCLDYLRLSRRPDDFEFSGCGDATL